MAFEALEEVETLRVSISLALMENLEIVPVARLEALAGLKVGDEGVHVGLHLPRLDGELGDIAEGHLRLVLAEIVTRGKSTTFCPQFSSEKSDYALLFSLEMKKCGTRKENRVGHGNKRIFSPS